MADGMLWIEITDEDGEETSVRWGSATDEQIDKITAYAEEVLGSPDTIS